MNLSLPENIDLPVRFVELMSCGFPKEVVERYFSCFNAQASPAVRFNPLKLGENSWDSICERFGYLNIASHVEWCSDEDLNMAKGVYLRERPNFTLDPFFQGGAYYVQDASSMFLNIVYNAIKAQRDSFVNMRGAESRTLLDLCAAPGGKTTHLATLFPDSLIIANEVIRGRAAILADNVAHWGASNVVVTNSDPAEFSRCDISFDLVLVDAPCSGEGMFRKEPKSLEQWSLDNVKLCAERQRRIIADIWDRLAPGGYLVYSTCTFNHFENDDNLEFIISLGGERVDCGAFADSRMIIGTKGGGYQFVPGTVDGEGQYFALVRKRFIYGAEPDSQRGTWKKRRVKLPQSPKLPPLERLLGPETVMETKGNFVKICRAVLYERMKNIEECLKVIHSGVMVAELRGKELMPHADLALSEYAADFYRLFPRYDANEEIAVKFLCKESFVLNDAPMGFLTIVYKGIPLGFVKNIGSRINNLLPVSRRIRIKS